MPESTLFRCNLCYMCNREISATCQNLLKPEELRTLYTVRRVSESEASALSASIREADYDLCRYDIEITRLRRTLKTLEAQRASLELQRDQRKALVSPVRILPIEILSEIFFFVCDSSYSLVLTQDTISTPALNLSQVCHVWRNVVNSRVSLWTNLSINLIHHHEMGRALQAYESRYKTTAHPLDLTIVADGESEDDDEREGVIQPWGWEIWNSLVGQAHRWRNITLSGPWITFFCPLLDFTDSTVLPFGGFPKLEVLKLEWEHISEEEQGIPIPFFHFFNSSPLLKSLSIPEYQYWYSFPFEQLTTISTLEGWSHRQVIHFLQRSPLIRTIGMDAWRGYDYVDEDRTIFQSALTSLSLFQRESTEAMALVNHLKLADLVFLHVESTRSDEPCFWEKSLSDLFLRSACPLQHLTLDGTVLQSESDLISLCRLVPTLTHLSIQVEGNMCTFTNAFFTELTIVSATSVGSSSMTLPQGEPILPHLSYLVIHMDAGYTHLKAPLPSVQAILTMAQSRSPMPPEMSIFLPGLPATSAAFTSALQTFHFGLSAVPHLPPSIEIPTAVSALKELHKPLLLANDWSVDKKSRSTMQSLRKDGMNILVAKYDLREWSPRTGVPFDVSHDSRLHERAP